MLEAFCNPFGVDFTLEHEMMRNFVEFVLGTLAHLHF